MKTINTNWKIMVRHHHKYNSSNRKRHGYKYFTEAWIFDRSSGKLLGYGTAKCSHKDTPCRKVGRQIAVGRAFENYVAN